MRSLLLVGFLLAASPAAADVVDEEIDDADCASGRALVVDHGQTECLPEDSGGSSGGCATAPGGASPWALVALGAWALRRRR